MERKVFAVLSVDNVKAQEMGHDNVLSFLQQESGWLEESKIFLKDSFVAEVDEKNAWKMYVNYLTEWAFMHQEDCYIKTSPLSFEEWKRELFDCDYGRHVVKEILNDDKKPLYQLFDDGYWQRHEYDKQGNEVFFCNSNGFSCEYFYNTEGKKIGTEGIYRYSKNNWERTQSFNGEEVYKEYSNGEITGYPVFQSLRSREFDSLVADAVEKAKNVNGGVSSKTNVEIEK